MFILKNAMIAITRNKGRNVLIGLIILVIAFASAVTLAINNTANDLINSYESAYDKELTITFNREKMMKDVDYSDEDSRDEARKKFNDIASYTINDVKEFADSKYIKSYYYTYNVSLNGKSIEKVESESTDLKRPGVPGENGDEKSTYDFTLNGYSSLEAMSEFINGTYEMTDISDNAWDIAFTGNYVFINKELASYNNLKLNDKIELEDEDGNSYEFEVIGIYKENEDGSDVKGMFANSANTLIVNAESLENITSSNDKVEANISPTFIIDDYENADKIEEEFHKKGLNENFEVRTNEEAATSGLSSIKNVKSFATTFLIITLIIGGMVLLVINMINIRERKYEIGVFRTIGISKSKLTMQFLAELIIVGFVSLMIGSGIGALTSKTVSNSLLSNEIKSSQEANAKISNNFRGPDNETMSKKNGPVGHIKGKGMPNIEAYDSIDAVVGMDVLVELLAIGLFLILISSISSMISIQRFTPLTILKERS